MDLSHYYLGKWKRGEYQDIEGMREKSSSGKLVLIEEDTTINVYEDMDSVDVAQLYAEVCGQTGTFVLRKSKGKTEDRYFKCTTGFEYPEQKAIFATDKDGNELNSVVYLNEDDEIYDTNLTIGKEKALQELKKDIDSDDDTIKIEYLN
jgi:hypothetical protein